MCPESRCMPRLNLKKNAFDPKQYWDHTELIMNKIVWNMLFGLMSFALLLFCVYFWIARTYNCLRGYITGGVDGLLSGLYKGTPVTVYAGNFSGPGWNRVISGLLVMILATILSLYGSRKAIRSILQQIKSGYDTAQNSDHLLP